MTPTQLLVLAIAMPLFLAAFAAWLVDRPPSRSPKNPPST